MSNVGERIVAASLALQLLGLGLTVGPGEFIITSGPDDKAVVVKTCTSIGQLEEWIADRPTGAASRTPASRKPRVGDIVHYVSYGTPGGEYGSECRAAIVTELTEAEVIERDPAGDGTFRQTAGLMVANPSGQFFNRGVLQDEGEHMTLPGGDAQVTATGIAVLCDRRSFPGGTWHWAGDQ